MNMNQAAYQNDKNALGVTYETAALIGSRLRAAREHKRFSPSQVSARVKIRERYIEAIEIGDWDVLPPGLNGRGLIRLYARELAVAIPEFEAFHHLQTVMLEKQSESLMTASNKKSKYHPAAEESAEVIRSISRSEFQKGINLESSEYGSSSMHPDEPVPHIPSSKVYSRPVFSQRTVASTGSASIVTPNIYDVLGLQVDDLKVQEIPEPEYPVAKEQKNIRQNLPTAEPVKKSIVEIPPIVEKEKIKVEEKVFQESHVKKDLPFVTSKEVKEESVIKKRVFDLNPLQIVVLLSFLMIFIFVSLFLFSRNSSQTKVTNLSAKQLENEIGESEALPNSIVNSNIPAVSEAQKATVYPPQTKTVAAETKDTSLTPQATTSTTPVTQKTQAIVEVERIAKLNIISKVNITIEADGKQIFSGVHSSGVLDIPFKNKSEINMSDASKVSLIYEGVNHGPLGYAGRKRKIVLNAKAYVE